MANIVPKELIKQVQLDLKSTEVIVEQKPAMAECNELDFWL